MLYRLIYASQATGPQSDGDLVALLKEARANNALRGVTGLLLYSSQSFLQVLEGAKEDVEAIYAKIEQDRRHQSIRLLTRSTVESRKFDQWSRGFEHIDEDQLAKALPGFKAATEYPLVNPALIKNGAIAETLLTLYQRNTSEV